MTFAAPAGAQCPPLIGDVAPGITDPRTMPPTYSVVGDGTVDIADVVVALRGAVGLHAMQLPGGAACGVAADVAPGWIDNDTAPPSWYPIGDGSLDVGDVIGLLRSSVGLDQMQGRLTYYRDAKVVIDDRCARCHASGGIAPFPLTTWADVQPQVPGIEGAVRDRIMPPWPPSTSCLPLSGSRALTDADRRLLLAWIATGALRGDPSDEPPPRDPGPTPTFDTASAMAEPYPPDASLTDDYRCFVMDWPHATQKFITALRVMPDQKSMVHHVIAYAIAPADVAQAEANDAGDPGPGYQCFGGPGINSATWLGAWTPGAVATVYPAGTGIRIAGGSKLVVQFHYNLDNGIPGPDQSSLEFATADAVAKHAAIALLPAYNFMIPADDPSYTYSQAAPAALVFTSAIRAEIGVGATAPVAVHAVGLHMHQLGTDIWMHAGGQCVMEIPAWDFHWQDAYMLEAPLIVPATQSLSLSCTWDNSAANQAFVGGVQQQPRDVTWGEGSRDEMCLGIAYVTAP
jgi:hypothetical protein